MVSSKNAITHGLTARGLLPDESVDEFALFAEALRAELGPVGPIEDLLTERVISIGWRLRRVARAEAGILSWHYLSELTARAESEVSIHEHDGLDDLLRTVGRQVTDTAGHAAARTLLTEVRDLRRCSETEAGLAFARRAAEDDGLGKVTRYEVALERSLLRTLHELERVQAVRPRRSAEVAVGADASGSGESATE